MDYGAYQILGEGLGMGRLCRMFASPLQSGQVRVRVQYSSLNYKDALAVSGTGKILRQFPLVAGIDMAGVVESTATDRFKVGEAVLVTGCGMGESHDGGFAEYVTVPGDWVIPLGSELSTRDAMIYGTAGFTAGLCVHRMLHNGQVPELGPILITGASGGVGSLATAIFAKLGFEVWAVSGKTEYLPTMRRWGAREVLQPRELELGRRPLESIRFGGAVDNVGGQLLEGILRHVQLGGNVAAVGLAGGHQFTSSVMPFILRGVSLLGISSTNCPLPLRRNIWELLARDWRPAHLAGFVTQEIGLGDLEEASQVILTRKSHGRILVRLAE